ncbi:hypothetical protein EJB05_48064, partial [Eragrostis curvula]
MDRGAGRTRGGNTDAPAQSSKVKKQALSKESILLGKQRAHPNQQPPQKIVEHFVKILEREPSHVADRPSDYDRSITKSYHEQMKQNRK